MNILVRTVLGLLAVATSVAALADPDIEANRPVLDFEAWTFSDTTHVQSSVWIFNRGTTDLHIGEIGGVNPPEHPFAVGDGCAHETLAPSAHCELRVELLPDVLGTHTSDFDIASDDPNEPSLTITLEGRVAFSFVDGELDGLAAPVVMRCENVTSGQVVTRVLSNASRWDCRRSGLLAADDDEVKVTFRAAAEADSVVEAPVSAESGERDGGGAAPNLVVTPLTLDFGRFSTLAKKAAFSVNFENDNDVPVHFSEVATSNPLAAPFYVEIDRLSHTDCAPHDTSCGDALELSIGLRSAEGVFSDSFSVTSDDPVTPVVTIDVVGEMVADMLAGTIVGLDHESVTCRNLTTGQTRSRPVRDRWNCTNLGLEASAGDQILISVNARKE